ncbi:MAG TPA: FAD/NAD(P)-binding oxidoreductase [Bacteroidales bacterium]|nr:FAD/NAD(P)-binding oxidoreductase [Bacteroidales bacterium]
MEKLLILGAGTGGTLIANKLRKKLSKTQWDITIVDKDPAHYYQPGFLFIPFGIYKSGQVVKPKKLFIPKGVNYIEAEIEKVEPAENNVLLANGTKLHYDYLVVATGTDIAPYETPGLSGPEWHKSIFDFYTLEGATRLYDALKNFAEGNLVISIAELPFKCPVAPLEFAFLADSYFRKKGIRSKVNIFYTTPLPGAFTKPKATKMLGELLEKKGIQLIPDYNIEEIDNEGKKLVSYDGREVPFDLLTVVPVNMGAEYIGRSGMGDDLNFVHTNKHTLQSEKWENIFVLGDAANIPTSKAGSVVHFAAEILYENFLSAIEGKPLKAKFDGHANCFIITGIGEGTLIDFNYDVEPLPGTFPLPVIGPMKLLKVNRLNYWGKMAFKWAYWNLLIKGRHMPISTAMSMTGKKTD